MSAHDVLSTIPAAQPRQARPKPLSLRWVQLLFYLSLFVGWELLARSGVWLAKRVKPESRMTRMTRMA